MTYSILISKFRLFKRERPVWLPREAKPAHIETNTWTLWLTHVPKANVKIKQIKSGRITSNYWIGPKKTVIIIGHK